MKNRTRTTNGLKSDDKINPNCTAKPCKTVSYTCNHQEFFDKLHKGEIKIKPKKIKI